MSRELDVLPRCDVRGCQRGWDYQAEQRGTGRTINLCKEHQDVWGDEAHLQQLLRQKYGEAYE